jgi:protease-4
MNDHPPRHLGVRQLLDSLARLAAATLLLLLLAGAIAVAVAAYRSRPQVPEGAALVLAPRGVLVEELAGTSRERLAARLTGLSPARREVLLRDVLDALRLARDDDRIKAAYLEPDRLHGSMSKLMEVQRALLDFRSGGKPVVAYAEQAQDGPYYLMAAADEVYLHPDGLLVLDGFGGYRPYYKEALDRFGIDVHVFRVGEYKSAVEPYLRRDMSPEAREAAEAVLQDLWGEWLADVSRGREREVDELRQWIERWPDHVDEARGDVARAALDAGLVDHLAHRDEVRTRMIELVGENDEGTSFEKVDLATYLAARAEDRPWKGGGEGVAVVVAAGDVLDGDQPPGRIGADSTSRLIRRARENEKARAVVLRVDSGGGSVFASDVIRRECTLVHDAGKPLVVSMSSVAASAAYAISSPADEIWASPATITGSIGIFALFPSVPDALERYLGVSLDGVGTTPWTDALNPGRPLDPRVAGAIQTIVDEGYDHFVTQVAEARGQTWKEVDRVARGRVWSGRDALELGLVDRMGDLDDAIASAAEKAGLEEGYAVFVVERERSLRERVLERLLGVVGMLAPAPSEPSPLPPPSVARELRRIEGDLGRLALWNDPRGLYGHCLCGEEWP